MLAQSDSSTVNCKINQKLNYCHCCSMVTSCWESHGPSSYRRVCL
uniref:Uncharacterized protein n=1 Tax=Rhizophora mucronata TaxID=61149 RepID=A0A2P2N489_RHIMU